MPDSVILALIVAAMVVVAVGWVVAEIVADRHHYDDLHTYVDPDRQFDDPGRF